MGAGESAASEAARARRAAGRLARKAVWADRVADNYEKGALGESLVAEALAPLEARGWRVLHDLRHPDGGNIDHVAIGPPGVAVLDAKHWKDPVTITPDRRLVHSKHDRSEVVEKLDRTLALVRDQLASDGVRVAVRGFIVLTSDVDRGREVRDIGDVRILGVEGLEAELLRARGDLEADLIEAIAATLATRLPSASDPQPRATPELEEPSELFEKAQRFYYLRPWRKGGHNRLYLRDASGTTLGWTDVNTGATTIDCSGDDAKFAKALLAAADPTGMKLAPGDLPKVATRLWGGRLLSKFARFHTSVLVGQEWRRYDKHRLYGTLIDPTETTWNLGYVDLKTRAIHPAIDGNLSEQRGPAERYLGFLLHKYPEGRSS